VVAVTGASNVTGEVLPIAEIAEVAHRHGGRIVVDAAQLAPHRRVNMAQLGIDYLAFSGHKLYAPYGAGVLVGPRDWLDAAPPHLAGGGALQIAAIDDVQWSASPARHEGGTPNVVGAVAIAAACRALTAVGLDLIAAHDELLVTHLVDRLNDLHHDTGFDIARLAAFTDSSDRVGIATLHLPVAPALAAAALSAEHGIGTRDGAFCAHPLMRRLLGTTEAEAVPNALRVSVGVGTTTTDIDYFIEALGEILRDGPRWTYHLDGGRLSPLPDPRSWPDFSAI
jgi:selenocysteine lyase/cysteine desulfurase